MLVETSIGFLHQLSALRRTRPDNLKPHTTKQNRSTSHSSTGHSLSQCHCNRVSCNVHSAYLLGSSGESTINECCHLITEPLEIIVRIWTGSASKQSMTERLWSTWQESDRIVGQLGLFREQCLPWEAQRVCLSPCWHGCAAGALVQCGLPGLGP